MLNIQYEVAFYLKKEANTGLEETNSPENCFIDHGA